MEVLEAIKSRRTVRQYDPTYTIPDDILQQLIDIALDSPTGRNLQGIDLLVVTNRAKIDEATMITFNSWDESARERWNHRKEQYGVKNVVSCDAPAIFFFVKNENADDQFVQIDVGIMVESLMAAARHFDYHSMCIGALLWGNKAGLEKCLGIPEGKLLMALAIGKSSTPNPIVSEKTRKCKATILK